MRELELQLRAYGGVLDAARPSVVDTVDASPRLARRSLIVAAAAAIVVAIAVSAIAFGVTRTGDSHRPKIVTPNPSGPLPTVGPKSVTTNIPTHLIVTAIGDSVMEGAEGALRTAIPGIVVDATTSRQPAQAVAVLDGYAAAGKLPATVVIGLGTNGRITPAVLDEIMRAAGDRRVYFVTVRVPRAWQNDDNAQLRALPSRWSNAHVIDWHEYANAHADWFLQDGFHLNASGQQGYAGLIASTLGRLPKPTPNAPSGLNVVALGQGGLPPAPLAVAGGRVWIASNDYSDPNTTSFVRLQRRDPSTTKLLGSVNVHQEAVYAIAGDGDTLWVAGGGDGGVPETTVSRVDARTGSVVFTKTLTGTPCACPIVAGNAGVWLVGGGTDVALHLSAADGHVIAAIMLPRVSRAAMETRFGLLVGLDDGSVVRVNPVTNRVVENVPTRGTTSTAPVTAMAVSSVAKAPIAGFVTHADGQTFAIDNSSGDTRQFMKLSFTPTAVADVGGFEWGFGGDRLELESKAGEKPQELAYDTSSPGFTKVPDSPATQLQGFRDAVVAGDRVWVFYDDGVRGHPTSVLVITAPSAYEG
jgi:hypothetical protein